MIGQLPQVTHTYQNHVLDSTRWQHYQPRPDDIIIATSYKSGTTWMQEIVRQLIFLGQAVPTRDGIDLGEVSLWLDARWGPIDEVISKLEAQQHRRFIKTHLPLDGLPFYPQVKYVVVGRDARDVAMSLWNHHTQTWWAYRHLPNLHFVHYADLKTNLAGEVRLLADFLEIPLPESALPNILQATSLGAMRNSAERLNPGMTDFWKEGAKTFFFKGTNGRWRDVLSAEELALYEEKAAQVLMPDCQAWLERGRCAVPSLV